MEWELSVCASVMPGSYVRRSRVWPVFAATSITAARGRRFCEVAGQGWNSTEMTTGVARAGPGRLRAVAAKSAFGRHRLEAVAVGHFLTTVLVLSCLGFLFFLSFFCELLPLPIGV